MPKPAVLVVDDEPALLRLMRVNLEPDYRVLLATEADKAIQAVAQEQPDLVILDILLGNGPDGFEVCRHIREFSDIPIILLTAKAKEADKLHGFAAGADDYVTKPFSPRELLARMTAILRRGQKGSRAATCELIKVGPLTVDAARRRATLHKQKLVLTPTEYKLLYYLASHQDKVLLHSEILTAVWGSEYRDEVEYLRVYISRLRQKIEDNPCSPKLLHTQPGVGYVLSPAL